LRPTKQTGKYAGCIIQHRRARARACTERSRVSAPRTSDAFHVRIFFLFRLSARFLCRRLFALRDRELSTRRQPATRSRSTFLAIIEFRSIDGCMDVAIHASALFYTARSINPFAMHHATHPARRGISAAISRKSRRLEPARLLNCRESRNVSPFLFFFLFLFSFYSFAVIDYRVYPRFSQFRALPPGTDHLPAEKNIAFPVCFSPCLSFFSFLSFFLLLFMPSCEPRRKIRSARASHVVCLLE